MAESQVAAWEGEREGTRAANAVVLDAVVLATLTALAGGLGMLTSGPLAWDPDAAIAGLTGQLGETLPAAVLVLGASSLNLAAGAVLARAAVGRPLDGLTRLLLAATVGAVLLDTALLFLLGGTGLFRAPLLLAVNVAIAAAGWLRLRPIVTPGTVVVAPVRLGWAIVALAVGAAVVLQLASPVVPFLDVLPNHVAPVERLRTFGEFGVLTQSPSPIYGPSRLFLGYVALLGTVATMTGLPAGLAASAFILPGSILVAAGVHRLATALAGAGAGLWGLVVFTLTASFGRLTDARATVLVLPLALGALAWTVERLDEAEAEAEAEAAEANDADGADEATDAHDVTDRDVAAAERARTRRDALLLGAALGATVLFHPAVGALAVATVGLVALIRPAFAAVGVGAVATGSLLALPQAATMLGYAVPSPIALLAAPAAIAVGWLVADERLGFVVVVVGRALLVALVPVALVRIDLLVTGAAKGLGELVGTMPLLVVGAVGGFLAAPRAARHPVVLGALAAGAAVAALTQIVPEGAGLLTDSMRYELPKTIQYWLPVFAALVAAFGLVAVWRREALALPLRAALVGAFLVVAMLPLRSEEIDDHHFGEHRLSETIAVDLRWAGRGYWASYPDARHVVDAPRAELLDALRAEIAAGRLRADTSLLHVATTFQQWSATPIGVFTGVDETVVSPDASETIHTVGGRLRPLDRLDALLGSGSFGYVVLEPGDGLPPDARDRIVGAGYGPLFANGQGEVFVRG